MARCVGREDGNGTGGLARGTSRKKDKKALLLGARAPHGLKLA